MSMHNQLVIDTHAHFGVKENKEIESSSQRIDRKKNKFLADLERLREMVGAQEKNLIYSSNYLEDYIECMDRNGISISWFHQLSFESILGYEVLSNREIAKAIQKHPQRFRGFAGVNPHKGKDAVLELEDAIRNLGLHGLKLNPNDYDGFLLNDQKTLYPLYEKCQELRIPVSVHTGITPGSIFRMKNNYPLLLDDVAVDFPDLTIIVEHMGFPWNNLCYYMVERHENMFLTITAIANILVHSQKNVFKMELSKMLSQIGSEKVLWGSDWTVTPNIDEVLLLLRKFSLPLPMRMMGLKKITSTDINNILANNALKILP